MVTQNIADRQFSGIITMVSSIISIFVAGFASFSHNNNRTFREILHIIAKKGREKPLACLKLTPLFTLLLDEYKCTANLNNVSIFVKYFDASFRLCTDYLCTVTTAEKGCGSKILEKIVLDCLKDFNLNLVCDY